MSCLLNPGWPNQVSDSSDHFTNVYMAVVKVTDHMKHLDDHFESVREDQWMSGRSLPWKDGLYQNQNRTE